MKTQPPISDTTNGVLERFRPKLAFAIQEAKASMNVHHKRVLGPTRNQVKLRKKSSHVTSISIGTNRGEVLGAHKGIGKGGTNNRTPKPFINQPAEELLPELANELAMVTGDTICSRLVT